MGFDKYITSEGLNRPTGWGMEANSVNNQLLMAVTDAEPGSFFLKPRQFIDAHLAEITKWMRPEDRRELNHLFPPQKPGGERLR